MICYCYPLILVIYSYKWLIFIISAFPGFYVVPFLYIISYFSMLSCDNFILLFYTDKSCMVAWLFWSYDSKDDILLIAFFNSPSKYVRLCISLWFYSYDAAHFWEFAFKLLNYVYKFVLVCLNLWSCFYSSYLWVIWTDFYIFISYLRT